MTKRCIVHIPWQLTKDSLAATEIRPLKMRMAFEQLGYEVYFIMGDASTRASQIAALSREMQSGASYDFLYSESSTMPMLLTEKHHLPLRPLVDLRLFRLCSRHRVPIGLFLRDLYWAFPEVKRYGRLQTFVATLFHKLDILIYNRYVAQLFFPTQSEDVLRARVPLLRRNLPISDLMPGAEFEPGRSYPKKDYFLYMGAVSRDLNDISLLLKVFTRHPEHRLVLCTPRQVWERERDYFSPFLGSNIEVVHKVNDEAKELFSKARYGISLFPDSPYQKIAMHFKVFEYLSYDTPLICNKHDHSGALTRANGLGYAIEYKEQALDGLLSKLGSNDDYTRLAENIRAFKIKQTWQSRAEKVAELLRR